MAIYQSDAKRALQFLDKADVALLEHKNATPTAHPAGSRADFSAHASNSPCELGQEGGADEPRTLDKWHKRSDFD